MKNKLRRILKTIRSFPLLWVAIVILSCTTIYSWIILDKIDDRSDEAITLNKRLSEYLNAVAMHDYNMQIGSFQKSIEIGIDSALQAINKELINLDNTQPNSIDDKLNEELKGKVKDLIKQQSDLNKIFQSEVGSEKTGLYSRLREHAHEFDPTILVYEKRKYKALDSMPDAINWIYNYGELRRHEKDFLQRSRNSSEIEIYKKKVDTTILRLEKIFVKIDSANRESYSIYLKRYKDDFKQLYSGILNRNQSKFAIEALRTCSEILFCLAFILGSKFGKYWSKSSN